jgi:FixJ family two-component response regulator
MPRAPLVSVIDDDQFFRESMRRLMHSMDYPVEVFASAAEFIASSQRSETACLIADVQMPGTGGLELNQNLQNSDRPIPTILVTAFPNESDRIRAHNDGVVCYLSKPIDEATLAQCLRSALDHK